MQTRPATLSIVKTGDIRYFPSLRMHLQALCRHSLPYGLRLKNVMQITFYKSNLCPRCAMAGRHLRALSAEISDVTVEEIDIFTSPRRAWRDGIRMVPALKIGEKVLSGLYLSRETIADFLAREKS
jgi:glutaredoxin